MGLRSLSDSRLPAVETLPGHPDLRCCGLSEDLVESLIERTLDPADVRLREMTRDLSRFSSGGQLAEWRPGHDLVCLKDAAGELVGVIWVVRKEMPARSDYFDPQLIRERGPRLTWAIRTYGAARGHGIAYAFSEYALERLLRDRPEGRSLWYQTKAENSAARALGQRLGFFEASGDADGTVIGVRFSP
jgi:GNAT superfamily N-acetyltransferase